MSVAELQLLNEELLAALRSGVSLDLGLRESSRHLPGRMSQLANQLAGHLSDGVSLTDSLENLNPPPPTVYRVLVAAGVRGDKLEVVLTRMNEFSRVIGDLQDVLRRAIVYPAVVFLMTYLLTCLATCFCVPPLRAFLEDLHAEPTWSVRILYAMHDSFAVWATAVPAVVILAMLGGVAFDWAQSGTAGAFGFLRYLPGFGRLLKDADLSRFAHLLAIQTEYGLPLPESLRRCADAVAAPRFRHFCIRAADQVEQGESFGDTLVRSPGVPAFMKWALSVPNSQADLVANTYQAAELYRERTQLRAEWIARVVPMLLTLVFGTTVVAVYCWAVVESLITVWDKVM